MFIYSQEVGHAGPVRLLSRLLCQEWLHLDLATTHLLLLLRLNNNLILFYAIDEIVFVSGDTLELLLNLSPNGLSKLNVLWIDLIFVARILQIFALGTNRVVVKVVAR